MRKLQPIKGSVFVGLSDELKKILIENGAVPVNDIFFPYWECRSKIMFFYGGFGSGKSVFLVDRLIYKCLFNPYFRCFFGRKIKDTVRDSIYATICDRIEELGLQHYFKYSRADNSSMVIRCTYNGNSFHPFGADKVDSLKSIKDPTDIFCDEMDQFTERDLGVLLSRLRTEKAETQLSGAFNTVTVTDSHWIKMNFFADESTARYKEYARYSITKVFCNYSDNYFINQKEYEDTLWIAAAFDETRFRAIAAGEWGSDQKGNRFIYSFREKQKLDKNPGYCHVVEGMVPDYKLPLIVSFDFNVEPITATIWQHARDLSWISGLQEYRLLNSDIFELCTRIRTDHPEAFFTITGDASGRSRTAITRGNKNYYYFIKQELKVRDPQIILPGKNPFHANTRVLANVIFAKHPAIVLNKSMHFTIMDINNVMLDDDGGMEKGKDKYKGHLMDTMLYYFWNFHLSFMDKFKR